MDVHISKIIRVGTRKSQLAMIQTNTILKNLKDLRPDLTFEVVSMDTLGDKILDTSLTKIGETSVFTKELEAALLQSEIDMIVHSLKDLPCKLPDGLVVGAVHSRDSPYDVIVMQPQNKDKKLENLAPGSVIGTSSPRRMAQLSRHYPHLNFENIRGNLNSRIKQLDDQNKYAALILAEAGLTRMGWENRISERLLPDVCMYAVCQGAIGIECRADDMKIHQLLSLIHDRDAALQCVAERAFYKQLEVGYKVPVSVFSVITREKIELTGGVFSIDGTECKIEKVTKQLDDKGEKVEDLRMRREFTGILTPVDVSKASMVAAESAGIELASIMVNDPDTEKMLNLAKCQIEADALAKKQRKTMLAN